MKWLAYRARVHEHIVEERYESAKDELLAATEADELDAGTITKTLELCARLSRLAAEPGSSRGTHLESSVDEVLDLLQALVHFPPESGDDEPLLRMVHARKRLSTAFAIGPIDILEIRGGEVWGVVGTNGSGKSSLLRLLVGELALDAGDLEHPGLQRESRGRSWRSLVAWVPQVVESWPSTFSEELASTLAYFGVTGAKNARRAKNLLRVHELTGVADARWSQLSGGMRARCALALAMACDPRLLVLDEPLAPLDPAARLKFVHRLRVLADRDQLGVVVSSQHVPDIERVSDWIVVLDGGRERFRGVPLSPSVSDPDLFEVELTGATLAGLRAELATMANVRSVSKGLFIIELFPGVDRGTCLARLALAGELRSIRLLTGSALYHLWGAD
ncbi:MAG: ATP-binding cassette domain-containing protein [Deltaproteobacteria bacterium]|nr:ATP-binding cassette domain-containing protein [Deltaproteobacteria bacterium]